MCNRNQTFLLSIALILWTTFFTLSSHAHEGHTQSLASDDTDQSSVSGNPFFQVCSDLIRKWPTKFQETLIHHAAAEHRFTQNSPYAPAEPELKAKRLRVAQLLRSKLLSVAIDWEASESHVRSEKPLVMTAGLRSPVLLFVTNRTDGEIALRATVGDDPKTVSAETYVWSRAAAGETIPVLVEFEPTADTQQGIETRESFTVQLTSSSNSMTRELVVPIRVSKPATLRVSLHRDQEVDTFPGKLVVQGSDGVCRHDDQLGTNPTLTDKTIVFPEIGLTKKVPFFYSTGSVKLQVPAGKTRVTLSRGFEDMPETQGLQLEPGEVRSVEMSTLRFSRIRENGWVSGDTHVHWVTNAWNVDEPLELLSIVQRAEDLRVANNLTLLQRYANQAFIKPSQAPMGPVPSLSDSHFHIQMAEEYRNEDLYGHLCMLNLDWLVQPIGTGSIIAGPDALDYPLNRTAIELCREQGGISIDAHGLGGNKEVPLNVIHRLTDSLDQIEPEMYYRLLDCGFRLPLTNGSDHPARTLGVARCYARVEGEFTYAKWIDAIRHGRTFTTSGPLIALAVNDSRIGDVIDTGAEQILRIKAKVESRFPIGTFQIVSNNKVLAERVIDGTSGRLELTIPAGESRWVVARCSNRDDGIAEWGFGNYNAITGPGIAHTSPIYVQVAGLPPFDPSAVSFWQSRLREHLAKVANFGRYANDSQRREAVDYVEHGIRMYGELERQVKSARSRDESVSDERDRLSNIVSRFGVVESIQGMSPMNDLASSIRSIRSRSELRSLLEPLTLFSVSVNPESRVKLNSDADKIKLRAGRPQRFLVDIENIAGITAPLRIQAFDIASNPVTQAKWIEVEVVDEPFVSRMFDGAEREFKVIELTAHEPGLREVRLVGDAGQGTQDLGFQTTAAARIEGEPTVAVELIVNGEAVAQQELLANGKMTDLVFDYQPEASCWVALRVFPHAHTNPIYVEVDEQPMQPVVDSLRWCLMGVEQCWRSKQHTYDADEQADAVAAYEHARQVYEAKLAKATSQSE